MIAGVGQVTARPTADDPSTWHEPLELMVEALSRAGGDAAGGDARRSSLLDRVDEVTAIPSFVWSPRDPARAAAESLRISPRATRVTGPGGTVPQTALLDAATRIAAGELDVAVVVGAEAMKSRDLAKRRRADVAWRHQGDDVPAAPVVLTAPDALSDPERACGLALPVSTYALFEQALRRAAGLDRVGHLARLDALAARMREVARTTAGAWLRDGGGDGSVTAASPSNRMVSAPYTKLLASNVMVDMGAAIIVCSLEAARRAGVDEDAMVFPLAGAVAKEQWLVSTRRELSTSLAMAACARALFGPAAPSPEAVALVDLYSCFPSAVQLGCAALGIDPLTDPRPPTVTGGMTFFGGPGNNYVTHSIAETVARLRASPGATALVTALGWYASTHAWATYATTPPRGGGFAVHDAQGAVDAVPLREADWGYEGEAEVEAFYVGHVGGGEAARAIVSVLAPSGARRMLACDDAAAAAELEAADPLGGRVTVRDGWVTIR